MDAHPVPQNITAFEFHLIGDMTIKQFSYLAAGLITAYVTFILAFNRFPLFAIPVIGVSSLMGAAFAFVPIQDRPLDHWVAAFFKAVFAPTKRISKIKPTDPAFNNRLQTYLHAIHQKPLSPTAPVGQLLNKPVLIVNNAPSTIPTDSQLKKTVELGQQSQQIRAQIATYEKQLQQIKTFAASPGADPNHYADQIRTTLTNLQGLILTAQNLSSQLENINQPQAPATPNLPASEVKVVDTPAIKNTQISLTSQPNVINGIISDNLGNYLENVVVVIHNKEGLPVRASKTNKLGQFAGATPLPAGEYTVTLEKEGLTFDTLQLELKGMVLAPIQIKAKGGS